MAKNVTQLHDEIFSLISGQNLEPMFKILDSKFPRCRGKISNLAPEDLNRLIPMLENVYRTNQTVSVSES